MPQDHTFETQVPSPEQPTFRRFRTFWRRLWAGVVDGLVFLPVSLADDYMLSADRAPLTIAAWATLSYSAYWMYSVTFHFMYGQTFGKMFARIQVLDVSEETIPTVRQALLRELPFIVVSVASLFYLYYLVLSENYSPEAEIQGPEMIIGVASVTWLVLEIVTMLAHEKRRALHDLIAGTVVVWAPTQK